MMTQELKIRSQLDFSPCPFVSRAVTRCLALASLPFKLSRCSPALAFSSLILFLQCLAMRPLDSH